MAKGGDPITGLWVGTAMFSAMRAKTFGGFIRAYFWYALVIIVAVLAVGWILRKSGLLSTEKFSVSEIQCKSGETPTSDCNGERGCSMPSGNCYKLLSEPSAPPA